MVGEANDSQLSFVREQLQLCMLPSLISDLDEVQAVPAHFETYHSTLERELPKLYDILQRNEDTLFNNASHEELRAQLVLLLCELTASSAIYSYKGSLLRNANEVLARLAKTCKDAEDKYILSYYEQKLHKDCWKRQLGAVHGFVRFLEHRYGTDLKMPMKIVTFAVAVGLNVRESFQTEYKQLGVRIFMHLLKHGRAADLEEMNIHGVIYENVFKDVQSMDTVGATFANWDCLCQCLDHFTQLDAFTWNQCDDMLERLIQNVSLASDTEMAVGLLGYITRLGYYFAINRAEVEAALESDLTQPECMEKCLGICASLNVCTNYRWAKNILQMLVLASEKLLGSAEAAARMMVEMQRCYLVCILAIPVQASHVHLREFYSKFVAVLLEALTVHKENPKVKRITQQFINIFIYQLRNVSPDQEAPSNLNPHLSALENVSCLIAN